MLPVRAQVFRQELGWLGRLLGAVRDLDVQLQGLAGMSPVVDAPDGHDPMVELAALLEREREAARADMLNGLDSVRWERLAKGLTAMAQQGPARRSLATRVPAEIGLPELVFRRHHKVRKAATRARHTGIVTDFHALRIRCKRLRYALEFSSEVYGGKTSRFVRELTVLQDELGEMQDAEVASLQLADLATGDAHLPAATVFMMGGVAEQHRRQVRRFLKRLPDEFPRTEGRPWRELRDADGAPSGRGGGGPTAGAHHPARRAPAAHRSRARAGDRRPPTAPCSSTRPVHPSPAPGLTSLPPATALRPTGMSPRRRP